MTKYGVLALSFCLLALVLQTLSYRAVLYHAGTSGGRGTRSGPVMSSAFLASQVSSYLPRDGPVVCMRVRLGCCLDRTPDRDMAACQRAVETEARAPLSYR